MIIVVIVENTLSKILKRGLLPLGSILGITSGIQYSDFLESDLHCPRTGCVVIKTR